MYIPVDGRREFTTRKSIIGLPGFDQVSGCAVPKRLKLMVCLAELLLPPAIYRILYTTIVRSLFI